MKRFLLALIFILLLGLCACQEQAPAPTESAEAVPTTTLMVYMIGSDLEAKAAAGTKDMEEMVAGNADLSHTNVLVYAGGSPYWHNDTVVKECNTILKLGEGGFSAVSSQEPVSMGEAETLTGFLDYCCTNYPADRYALILWNHGSGPVMGYGQDLVFEGGSLLLTEMAQAMEASAFDPDNKLLFVGFDACLMASAELACIWDDYAQYMVSSQEVEPSIGWNYDFVKDLGNPDTKAMLQALTANYLATCEAYYEEKNFNSRETTLSCVDLSAAGDMEKAINELFRRALDDTQLKYDQLSALRVQTRAYGRASTGSEYDLVDLGDLAARLSALYPKEAEQLQAVLERMVISNATNTESCSGLSLYYPFYNKDYFYKSVRGADSWQTTYQNLGLFTAYQQYLDKYQQIWNSTDRLENFARSIQPSKESGAYTLQLTPEQAACYASAKYYILQRESSELYITIFSSSNITNEDGLLTANFDGNVIYVKDKYGNYTLPVVEEKDRIGDLSHYSIYVGLNNEIPTAGLGNNAYIGGEYRSESYRYHLTLDNATGQLSVNALLPHNEDPENLPGGKLEDADLSQWTSALFWDQSHRYLTRDENGLILPLDQWHENTWFTATSFYFTDALEFVYEPLDGGEYYLMMEVQDTQGSRYCSELLPIQVPDRELFPYEYPQNNIQWDEGDRILLAEEQGVAVYMNMVEDVGYPRFTLELENNADFAANLFAHDLFCNADIYCDSYYGSIHAEPGQSAWFISLSSLGLVEECGAIEDLTQISFTLFVRDQMTGAMLIEPQTFHVNLPEHITEAFRTGQENTNFSQTPFLGALAGEQVLYSDKDMRATLLGLGTQEDYWSDLYGIVEVENLSDQPLNVKLDGLAVNGRYFRNSTFDTEDATLPAHTKVYLNLSLSTYQFEEEGITQIESISLLLRTIRGRYTFFTGFSDPVWCPIDLSQKGTAPEPFREAQQVIYEKNGIRIALDPPESGTSSTEWQLTVYNGSDHSIKADVIDVYVNGKPAVLDHISDAYAGPGQYGRGDLYSHALMEDITEISFRIQILDIYEERILFTDDEVITLYLTTP